MMNKRSSAAHERWSRIVAEQQSSGLTVARFCERRGIAMSSFFPWRRRLKGTPAAAFVEATVRGVPEDECSAGGGAGGSAGGGGSGGVFIDLGCGCRVTVRRGFDLHLLREVIEALVPGGGQS